MLNRLLLISLEVCLNLVLVNIRLLSEQRSGLKHILCSCQIIPKYKIYSQIALPMMLPGAGCRYRSLPSSSACAAQRQEEWIWEDFSIHQNDGSWKLIFLWLVLWIELTELQFFLSHSSAHSKNESGLTQTISVHI